MQWQPAEAPEMTAVAKEKPKASDPQRAGRKSAPIQIEKELARMAAVIAAHDDVTISDLLTPVVRQFIMTNYERVKREIQARIDRMKAEG